MAGFRNPHKLTLVPLPYEDFDQCAQILDPKRLGGTRLVIISILRFIRDEKHIGTAPGVDMWRPHPYWLFRYASSIMREWKRREYRDDTWPRMMEMYAELPPHGTARPKWLGWQELHLSHKSALIRREMQEEERCIRDGRKIPPYINHYREAFPGVPPNLEYVWPTSK